MASEKQIAANRRNARKSTGPRTLLGKARSSRNALKHGFTAEHATSPAELKEMEARREAWSATLAPDDDPVKLDLVRQAVRSYHRIDRIQNCEYAISAQRSRDADTLWEREQADRLLAGIAKLETQPMIAGIELESTVAGCD